MEMENKETTPVTFFESPTYSGIDPFIGPNSEKYFSTKYWLKNEFSDKDEFCSIKCLGDKGSIFYPENTKYKLNEDDTVIGEYWFDGTCWCYALFPEYEYLSI
jgi:hypothetical protein